MKFEVKCPRMKAEDRRHRILEIAREMFLEHGLAGTSMSMIAARVGGSKGTLYNYFASKEALFEAMMVENFAHFLRSVDEHDLPGALPEEWLNNYGCQFLRKIVQPQSLGMFCLLAAEGARFPEIAMVFFNQGPDETYRYIERRLEQFQATGHIDFADGFVAAQQFVALLRGDLHLRVALGAIDPPDDAAIAAHVGRAVTLFLAAHRRTD